MVHDPRTPIRDQREHGSEVEPGMGGGIAPEIGVREVEQRDRWTQPLLLQMHERAGELDQALVEGVVGTALALREPELLEHVMGLEEQLLVEAGEIPEVTGVEPAALEAGDELGDLG